MELGVCLLNVLSVNPGRLVMHFFCDALCKVEGTGENNAAWANVTRSAGVADGAVMMVLAEWETIGVFGWSRCHKDWAV